MGAKIKQNAHIIKKVAKRLGQILGPDIEEEREELYLQNESGLTQEQKEILKKGIEETKKQERVFEDFRNRIKVTEKTNKIIVNEKTVDKISKENKSKDERTDIDY